MIENLFHYIGMKGTTVKIEGELLKLVESVKEPNQPVSGFVYQAVRRAAQEARRAEAAAIYNRILDEDPAEAGWLEEWENGDLGVDPVIVADQELYSSNAEQEKT